MGLEKVVKTKAFFVGLSEYMCVSVISAIGGNTFSNDSEDIFICCIQPKVNYGMKIYLFSITCAKSDDDPSLAASNASAVGAPLIAVFGIELDEKPSKDSDTFTP